MNSPTKITLIVDTNLFLECRSLDQIPWQDLGFDDISLIAPRPVQQEIDNHKKGIKGRTFKKALAATTLFRGIVVAGGLPHIVQDSGPRVTLGLMAQSKIDPTLAEDLDPEFNDDAIILRMLQYARDNAPLDVRLLTHDTGPMATVQSVGAQFIAIPDDWLSNENDDPTAKENRKLEAEVKRLKSQEPVFTVTVRGRDGVEIHRLAAEVNHYEELSSENVSTLMAELEEQHPPETDFGSAETTPQPFAPVAVRGITVTEFQPAKQADIDEYRDKKYPDWLRDCRSFYENLHRALNARNLKPTLRIDVSNTGSRPATQSLVRVLAMGDLEVFPVPEQNEDKERPSRKPLQLPSPPKPPSGKWVRKSAASRWYNPTFFGDPLGVMHREPRLNLTDMLPRHPKPRDPDAFYWKGGKPHTPRELVELTCDNWRHSISPESFDFDVYRAATGNVSGAIKFEIHADNLTNPVSITIPVSIEEISKSTMEVARNISAIHTNIDGLCNE